MYLILHMSLFEKGVPCCQSHHRSPDTDLTHRTIPNSFFKTLIDQQVTVELKNDIQLRGTLKSVDQYLNIKLDDIAVVEELKYPHLVRPPPLNPCAAP
ncbi:hypothetical protein E4U42_002747 [Claviceps africana]|uniref:Sm domain-containing protein n=1 Tax=Claviceps africana TaxID=83212 RepID=A0A8K0JCP8_9HYPO|nr:hypothetical protein E4U42_002747 [Claviceps africana]